MMRIIEEGMADNNDIETRSSAGSISGSSDSSGSLIFDNHDRFLDILRDIWPQMKGANILWFQNDLFLRIRQLEIKCEGVGKARGFLPASFEDLAGRPIEEWKSGNQEYEDCWAGLLEECSKETEDALDAFEDDVCGWIQDMIPIDYNFFYAALNEGTLNAEWLAKAQLFLEKAAADASITPTSEVTNSVATTESITKEPPKRHISSARTHRRAAGLPLTPSRVRRKIRMTRRR